MSKRVRGPILLLLTGLLLAAGIAAARSGPEPGPAPKPVPLEEATMIIEVNSTDRDAGLQVFLDGEPWRSMTVTAPNGRKILDVDAGGRLKRLGLTELFSESNEPEFKELPLAKLLERFPEGTYKFAGTTIEDRPIAGRAKFSHDIPDGPKILAPKEGGSIARDDAVARWNAPPETGGVEIDHYEVIVEREEPLRVFDVELPASADSVTIPSEFLKAGETHKIEVLAVEESGNQTISELEFRVRK